MTRVDSSNKILCNSLFLLDEVIEGKHCVRKEGVGNCSFSFVSSFGTFFVFMKLTHL